MSLCENCNSIYACTVAEKSKEACFFFVPTEEYRINNSKEYAIGYEQGRADERAKVFELITQRLAMGCDIENCNDCEECCEVSALMWLDEQLKEQNN